MEGWYTPSKEQGLVSQILDYKIRKRIGRDEQGERLTHLSP